MLLLFQLVLLPDPDSLFGQAHMLGLWSWSGLIDSVLQDGGAGRVGVVRINVSQTMPQIRTQIG